MYLNFDPMAISRARKLKMKHEKITYFRHYVPWTKIPDEMNKSIIIQIKDYGHPMKGKKSKISEKLG
jgi:hypothetical protein